MYDYANVLFTGNACNLHCYDCIGKNPLLRGLPSNLHLFPPVNIDGLIDAVNEYHIPDLAFTGTNVDPQLYRHETKLIGYVRSRLETNAHLSLHTNGLLALRDMAVFNSYDKASLSIPSFNPAVYEQVTGSRTVPDVQKILDLSKIPVKLSMLITPFNIHEMGDYIQQSAELGFERIVVRKLKGRDNEFPLETIYPFLGLEPIKKIFGWPVYEIEDVEVTVCGFDSSTARGLFLFSDGRLEDKLI